MKLRNRNGAKLLGVDCAQKIVSTKFLITVFLGGLLLVNILPFVFVHASVDVTGIISSDTIWTKANSPYTLTGNVLVANGVTLTIEPGATVNLNTFFIMVNGTMRARGTVAEKVQFSGGSITFTQYSAGWNEATGSGSIVEYADLNSTNLSTLSASPKINGSSILGITIGGLTVISNSYIKNLVSVSGSPSILYNTINGGISVASDAYSPIISYNTISGVVSVAYNSHLPLISQNSITGGLVIGDQVASAVVSYNIISGGMNVSAVSATVSFNSIVGGIRSSADSITFLNNTLTGSNVGIDLTPKSPVGSINASITNNTITASTVGISIAGSLVVTFYGWYTDACISGNVIFNCATAGIQVGGATAQGGHTP